MRESGPNVRVSICRQKLLLEKRRGFGGHLHDHCAQSHFRLQDLANQIDFRKIEEGLPAFLTIILIPLTFSITQGILWGFISHVGLYLVVGRRKEIHPVMFVLALIAIGLLLLEHSQFSKALYE